MGIFRLMKILIVLFLFLFPLTAQAGPVLVKKNGRILIEERPDAATLFPGDCYKDLVRIQRFENGDWQITWEIDPEHCPPFK
jgi:hypothetical protein